MKRVALVFVVAIAAVATRCFVYQLPFSVMLPAQRPERMPNLGSWLCAFMAGRCVWRHAALVLSGFVARVIMGGLITGAIDWFARGHGAADAQP